MSRRVQTSLPHLHTDVLSAHAARLEAAKVGFVGRLRPTGLRAAKHLLRADMILIRLGLIVEIISHVLSFPGARSQDSRSTRKSAWRVALRRHRIRRPACRPRSPSPGLRTLVGRSTSSLFCVDRFLNHLEKLSNNFASMTFKTCIPALVCRRPRTSACSHGILCPANTLFTFIFQIDSNGDLPVF